MRLDAQVAQDLGNDRFAEQAAELHAVVQADAPQSEESLAVGVFVEFDQKTALVLLRGGRGTVSLEAEAYVVKGNITPAKGRRHVDSIGQSGQHFLQVFFGDAQVDRLDGVGTVELVLLSRGGIRKLCI